MYLSLLVPSDTSQAHLSPSGNARVAKRNIIDSRRPWEGCAIDAPLICPSEYVMGPLVLLSSVLADRLSVFAMSPPELTLHQISLVATTRIFSVRAPLRWSCSSQHCASASSP